MCKTGLGEIQKNKEKHVTERERERERESIMY